MWARLGLAIIGLMVLGTHPILSQGPTAVISGVVHDTTGGVVPGAIVSARHIENGPDALR